jgi:hypothetical protein
LIENPENYIIGNNYVINKKTGRSQTLTNAQKDIKKGSTINDFIYNKDFLLYNEITNRFILNTKENKIKLSKQIKEQDYVYNKKDLKTGKNIINDLIVQEKHKAVEIQVIEQPLNEIEDLTELNEINNVDIKIQKLDNRFGENSVGVNIYK